MATPQSSFPQPPNVDDGLIPKLNNLQLGPKPTNAAMHLAAELSCQSCHDMVSSNYCRDCFILLCSTCSSTHSPSQPHRILNIDEYFEALKSSKDVLCPQHNAPLYLYCLTCDGCVCQMCRLTHMNHIIKLVVDYVKEDVVTVYDKQIDELKNAIDSLNEERDKIVLDGEAAKRKIHRDAQKMLEKLMKYEQQINDTVDKDVERKLKTLSNQEKEVAATMKELSDCEQYIELSLQYGTPEQVLMEKGRLMEHMETVLKKAQEKSFEPLVEVDISITRN